VSTANPALPYPLPILIDTDPGVDDALALVFAAACPELEVVAVTTVAGNVDLEQATGNATRILPVAWEDFAPPIYRGESGAGIAAHHVHGSDGLGGATRLTDARGAELYPPAAATVEPDAPGAILRLLRARPDEITVVALGPLTNLARAWERDPEALRLAREIVVMGGAFRELGNVTPAAEFNIHADPSAAAIIAGAGLPLRWVPLDVTHRCLLRQEHLDALPNTRRARFVRDITAEYIAHHHSGYAEIACILHDPVAVAAALWPELFRTERTRVEVETAGHLTLGVTVADLRAPAYRTWGTANADVCLEVDAETVVRRIAARLG
jgi:inosine-uridine nucleoside N-ribohydrolase